MYVYIIYMAKHWKAIVLLHEFCEFVNGLLPLNLVWCDYPSCPTKIHVSRFIFKCSSKVTDRNLSRKSLKNICVS